MWELNWPHRTLIMQNVKEISRNTGENLRLAVNQRRSEKNFKYKGALHAIESTIYSKTTITTSTSIAARDERGKRKASKTNKAMT